jgi:solute:Na+ symporter, SSS family
MFLVAWWELAGFVGLMMLAFIFVPIYYRNNCTTVTELLEKRYKGGSVRTVISMLFLLGNILIYLPAALYSGSLFLKSMFGVDWSLIWFAAPMAIIAAIYTITGGLRAVAVMDTYSGIGVLAIALLIVFLALSAINFDLSGVPLERVSMVGKQGSPIPFHTLFTGMIFIQIFYWSTNQNITQKAMTAPNVKEAQRGVLAAAAIRIFIIPAIVVIPGVCAYKLFGNLGDQSYGRIVAHVLPGWLSGAFAAMMAAAVIAHTSAILNSSVALYSVDFHHKFTAQSLDKWKLTAWSVLGFVMGLITTVAVNRISGISALLTESPSLLLIPVLSAIALGALFQFVLRPAQGNWRLAGWVSAILTVGAVVMVPVFENATSIINLLQELNGLLSMPILSAFVAGLLFRNVDARAAVAGLLYGVGAYAFHNFILYKPDTLYAGQTFYEHMGMPGLHYIDVMVIVLVTSVLVALSVNRLIFGNRARFILSAEGRAMREVEATG